jgi:hypothetical protein
MGNQEFDESEQAIPYLGQEVIKFRGVPEA